MDNKNEEEANSTGTWRIKKEISLGDLVAFAMAFFSVVYAYSTLDRRLAIIEDRQTQQVRIDLRQDEIAEASLKDLKDSIKEISHKLDRVIERVK